MPIKLKKSDIKDKLDNPKAGYMILGLSNLSLYQIFLI